MSEDVPDTQATLKPDDVLADSVVDDVADQLGLEPFSETVRKELRAVTKRYAFDLKIFGTHETNLKSVGADYKALQKKVSEFRAFLEKPEYVDLESDLHWAALHKNEPAPETVFPEISEFEKTRGKSYMLELKRLLLLLESATDLAVEKSALPKGRKPKVVTLNLVRRLAYVWTEQIKQKFSIDYHEGSGLTPAFQFVSLIVHKLIPEVTQTEIVTAMRTVVAESNQTGPNSQATSQE